MDKKKITLRTRYMAKIKMTEVHRACLDWLIHKVYVNILLT